MWGVYIFKTRKGNTVKHIEKENLRMVAFYMKFEEGRNDAVC